MDVDSIKVQVASEMGVQITTHEKDLENSIERLVQSGWIVTSGGSYWVESENQRLIRTYERKFEEMMTAFERQVSIDAVKLFDVDEEAGPRFSRLLIETLIDIFENRGREIPQSCFRGRSYQSIPGH